MMHVGARMFLALWRRAITWPDARPSGVRLMQDGDLGCLGLGVMPLHLTS